MTDESVPVISLDSYRIERGTRYCRHRSRTIDLNARKVSCRECHADLDPFDALHEIAREHEHTAFRLADLRRKITETTSRLDELKRQETNARARVKRVTNASFAARVKPEAVP